MDRLARLAELLGRWSELTDDEIAEFGTLIDLTVTDDVDGVPVLYWDDDRLASLGELLASTVDEILDGDVDDDALAALEVLAATSASITAEQTARDEAAAQADADATARRERAEALAAQVRGDQPGEGDGDEPGDGEGDGGGEGDEPAGDEPAGDEGAQAQPEPVTAATTARPAVAPVGARRPARTRPRPSQPAQASLVAAANLPGVQAGTRISSLEDLGHMMVDTYESMAGLGAALVPGMRVPVARLRATFEDERFLNRNVSDNMDKIRAVTSQDAITASGGFCNPLPPRYELLDISTPVRPVRDEALVNFGADRGGVTWMPSPMISDLDGSVSFWTPENDANPGSHGPATKPCLRIECAEPETAKTQAIVKCLEFGNWDARTWPENMNTHLGLANSWHSRVAESELLRQIGAGSTQVNYGTHFGAARDVLTMLDVQISQARSAYRMDPSVRLRFVAPVDLLARMRSDLAREMPGAPSERLAVADAQIASFFAVRGVNITWTLDGESGQIALPQGDGQAHGWHPTTVTYLYPEGSWLFLDGGTLDLGVVRDSTLNATNDFQVFSESWERAAFIGVWSQRITLHLVPDGSTAGSIDGGNVDIGTS